jgi:hypothetical protein
MKSATDQTENNEMKDVMPKNGMANPIYCGQTVRREACDFQTYAIVGTGISRVSDIASTRRLYFAGIF